MVAHVAVGELRRDDEPIPLDADVQAGFDRDLVVDGLRTALPREWRDPGSPYILGEPDRQIAARAQACSYSGQFSTRYVVLCFGWNFGGFGMGRPGGRPLTDRTARRRRETIRAPTPPCARNTGGDVHWWGGTRTVSWATGRRSAATCLCRS